jgi:hypothetical protein
VQTGLTGPHFNGYYFNILEAGADWMAAGKYPGEFGAGLWYQTGLLRGPPGISENGTGGFFGIESSTHTAFYFQLQASRLGNSRMSPLSADLARICVIHRSYRLYHLFQTGWR